MRFFVNQIHRFLNWWYRRTHRASIREIIRRQPTETAVTNTLAFYLNTVPASRGTQRKWFKAAAQKIAALQRVEVAR